MAELVKVVVDAMGGDLAPVEPVKAAVEAVKERKDILVILTGQEEVIHSELKKYQDYPTDRIQVVNATEVIETAEPPVFAIRKKKDSSIVVGLDCGANVDARPSHLVQFAKMGSIYMEHVVGIKNPRVAIVNNGAEEEKGNALVKETFPLLKEAEGINFIGSIEARDIPAGYADVIVCEAFVGNVILKLYEGVSSELIHKIKDGMMSTLKSKIGALLVKPALKQTLKSFDATEYGGAPLLGLKGLVVKTHGSAKAIEIKHAIFQCVQFKQQRINEKIAEKIQPAQFPAPDKE